MNLISLKLLKIAKDLTEQLLCVLRRPRIQHLHPKMVKILALLHNFLSNVAVLSHGVEDYKWGLE